MQGVAVKRVAVGDFHHLAEIHHDHAIGNVAHHRQIVRDEQIREFELTLQVFQQIHDLRLDRNVERRHRLVAHDDGRLHGQRARDAHALALTA